MGAEDLQDITGLLQAYSLGDRAAFERLIPLIEKELRQIASRYLRGRGGQESLQTTSLVNEAYLRLVNVKRARWRDRAHFFAICSRVMRSILVDHARARRAAKRGGGASPLPMDEGLLASPEPASDLVAIDEALVALSGIDPRKGQVVELRFFGGLTVEETAEVLKISPNTVKRDWRLAKLWLMRELSSRPEEASSGH